MIEINLDREYYSQHQEILRWLYDNVGPGGGWRKNMPDDWCWDFAEIFGHARIRFRHDEHALLFRLTW